MAADARTLPATKFERIAAAVAEKLDQHREAIEADRDLRSVQVTVKVTPSGHVRAVLLTQDSEWARDR